MGIAADSNNELATGVHTKAKGSNKGVAIDSDGYHITDVDKNVISATLHAGTIN